MAIFQHPSDDSTERARCGVKQLMQVLRKLCGAITLRCIDLFFSETLGLSEVRPAEVRSAEVRPAEVCFEEDRPAEVRRAEVRRAEVRRVEVRFVDVRLDEVRPDEVRRVEARFADFRPAEVRSAEIRPAEVHSPEVRPAEVRPAEVHLGEVCRSKIKMLIFPFVFPISSGENRENSLNIRGGDSQLLVSLCVWLTGYILTNVGTKHLYDWP